MSRSILIVVTHLLGVGHLTRAAALGRGLAAAGHRVTLVSGGAPRARSSRRTASTVVQLPPVHCRGTDFRTLLGEDGAPVDAAHRWRAPHRRPARRARRRRSGCRGHRDLPVRAPRSSRRSSSPCSEAARAAAPPADPRLDPRHPQPAVAASQRGRGACGPRPLLRRRARAWRSGRRAAGCVLAGRRRRLRATAASTPAISPTTGHDSGRRSAAETARESWSRAAAARPACRSTAPRSRQPRSAPAAHRWRILVGHGVGDPRRRSQSSRAAAPATSIVERARPDFPRPPRRARPFRSARPATTPSSTSRAAGTSGRARSFRAGQRGRAAPAGGAAGGTRPRGDRRARPISRGPALAAAVAVAAHRPRPVDGAARADLGGIDATGRDRRGRRRRARAAQTALARALDAALDASLAGRGPHRRVWWRDDDAVAPPRRSTACSPWPRGTASPSRSR